MSDKTKPTTARWLVGGASLLAAASGVIIIGHREEKLAIKDDIVIVQTSQPSAPARSPVQTVDTTKQIDLSKSLERKFSFVKNGRTLCNNNTCVVSGMLDLTKEMQSVGIKNFINAGLNEYVSNNGYVPLSDIDMLVLSEDEVRFSLKYRAAITN